MEHILSTILFKSIVFVTIILQGQPDNHADDPDRVYALRVKTKRLLKQLGPPDISANERTKIENQIAQLAPRTVLPVICPYIAQGMPGGPIVHEGDIPRGSGGPPRWKAYYSIRRIWDQIAPQEPKLTAGYLSSFLNSNRDAREQINVIKELKKYWSNAKTFDVEQVLQKNDPTSDLWAEAAHCLLLHECGRFYRPVKREVLKLPGRNPRQIGIKFRVLNYLMAAGSASVFRSFRERRQHPGISYPDPDLITTGFEMLAVLQNSESVRGYFAALRLGEYMGKEFEADHNDAQYHDAKGGWRKEYFSDTVRNALRWWKLERSRFTDATLNKDASLLIERLDSPLLLPAERVRVENRISTLVPRITLPILARRLAEDTSNFPMYPGSDSAEMDHKYMPADVRAFYSLVRVWNKATRLDFTLTGQVLVDLLKNLKEERQKKWVIHEIKANWSQEAEQPLAAVLRDADACSDLWFGTVQSLFTNTGNKYYADVKAQFLKMKDDADRLNSHKIRLLQLLMTVRPGVMAPLGRKNHGNADPPPIDVDLIVYGFETLREKYGETPFDGYSLALRLGDYLKKNFKPNQYDAKYQAGTNLKKEFFADATRNALKWWATNKETYMREIERK